MSVRVAGTDMVLPGSPKIATQNANMLRYLRPLRGMDPASLVRMKRMMNHRTRPTGVSIVMPVFNTPREWLIQALESVRVQWCDRWELVCVNDCSTQPHVAQILAAYAKHDSRIRVLNSPQNLGIARATNLGLRAAASEYVAFMDHDDVIEPDAVYHLLRTAKLTGAEFIYSDEATTDENIVSIADVKARPQFSYDYYLSHPYFVHMLCVKRSLAYAIGGWDESMAISADVDFVLRILERTEVVAHVPRVLYRWRTHGSSTGHSKKEAVMAATRGALQRHLDRRGTGAVAEDGVWFNQFRINWPESKGRILIVIPTKNKAGLVRTAVESIEKTAAGADYKLVLVDHESTDPGERRLLRRVGGAAYGDGVFGAVQLLAHQQRGGAAAWRWLRVRAVPEQRHRGDHGWLAGPHAAAGEPGGRGLRRRAAAVSGQADPACRRDPRVQRLGRSDVQVRVRVSGRQGHAQPGL